MANSNDIPDGYKATELGVLPKEWNVVKIIDVVDFTKKPRSISIASDQILPFISMDLIPDNNNLVTHWHEKKYSEISSGTFVFKGDLIVAKITPCFENGKQAILDNLPSDFAYTTTEVWPMHPKDNRIFIDFLGNYLRAHPVRKELTSKMEGSTNRQRLPRESLQNLSIPLPPLPEQHAIAITLRTVQEARENTDAVIAATKALKAAMMKHLFMYGPVPPEEAEKIELQDSDFGSFPKKWRLLPLDKCAYVQTGATKGKRFSDDDAIEVPYLRVANVQDGYLDLSEMKSIRIRKNELNRFSLKKGDVVVTEGGDFDKLGRGFIWQGEIPVCVHQNHIFAMRPDPEMVLPEYLAFLIQSEYGKKYFVAVAHRTTHLACINSTKLKLLPVIIPTLSEQRIIINDLKIIDQKLAAEQSRKEALDTLFTSLLHDLMTAKIRIKQIAV